MLCTNSIQVWNLHVRTCRVNQLNRKFSIYLHACWDSVDQVQTKFQAVPVRRQWSIQDRLEYKTVLYDAERTAAPHHNLVAMVTDDGPFATVHRKPTVPVCGSVPMVTTLRRPDPFPPLDSRIEDENHDVFGLVLFEIQNGVLGLQSGNPLELAVWSDLHLAGAGHYVWG